MPCKSRHTDTQHCDKETLLKDFWGNTAAAIHTLNNDIDLTEYKNQGKPSSNFELFQVIELHVKRFGDP